MELSEIEAEIARLEKLKVEALAQEEEKKARERFEEAVVLIPEMIAIVRRLDELGYLPKRLADVLTDADGKVNPGMYLKRPRAQVRLHAGTSADDQPTPETPSALRRKSPRSRATA